MWGVLKDRCEGTCLRRDWGWFLARWNNGWHREDRWNNHSIGGGNQGFSSEPVKWNVYWYRCWVGRWTYTSGVQERGQSWRDIYRAIGSAKLFAKAVNHQSQNSFIFLFYLVASQSPWIQCSLQVLVQKGYLGRHRWEGKAERQNVPFIIMIGVCIFLLHFHIISAGVGDISLVTCPLWVWWFSGVSLDTGGRTEKRVTYRENIHKWAVKHLRDAETHILANLSWKSSWYHRIQPLLPSPSLQMGRLYLGGIRWHDQTNTT